MNRVCCLSAVWIASRRVFVLCQVVILCREKTRERTGSSQSAWSITGPVWMRDFVIVARGTVGTE